jgi:phage-related protein
MCERDKPLIWLEGEVKTPPFSPTARVQTGYLLRKIQKGETVPMPHSRPLPVIGKNVSELRISDQNKIWRIIYHISEEAVVILEVFQKKTQKTPQRIIEVCQQRLDYYYT